MDDTMIPVEQRHMALFDENGDNVQRGDCLTASVASLLELPIDEVPFFVESDSWLSDYQSFFWERGFQLGQVRIDTDENDSTKLRGGPVDGVYWLATVKSPRGRMRCATCKGEKAALAQWIDGEHVEYDDPQPCRACDATGLVPSLHSVVMCGRELVWDPHPQREMGHLGFVSGEWLIARDPALLVLREKTAVSDT